MTTKKTRIKPVIPNHAAGSKVKEPTLFNPPLLTLIFVQEAALADGVVGGEAFSGDGAVGGDGHGQDAGVGDDLAWRRQATVSTDVGTHWRGEGRTWITHHVLQLWPLIWALNCNWMRVNVRHELEIFISEHWRIIRLLNRFVKWMICRQMENKVFYASWRMTNGRKFTYSNCIYYSGKMLLYIMVFLL